MRTTCLAISLLVLTACPPPDPGGADAAPEPVPRLAPCADGLDNDGDGWADAADPDCTTGNAEDWVALAACSDGIDNDRDGTIDSADKDCTGALDDSELDHPGNPKCSNGIDDDGDGLIDYGIDPGCASPTDGTESDEGLAHNFKFAVAPDTQLVDVRWIDPGKTIRQVVSWNPAQHNFYLHDSTYHVGVNPNPADNYGFQYSTDGGVSYTQLAHAQLAYSLTAQDANGFRVRVDPIEPAPHFRVEDQITFRGDTIYWSVQATNLHPGRLKLRVPVFFSGLMLGDRTATSTNGVPTRVTLFSGTTNAVVQPDYRSNGAATSRFPGNIGLVSPVLAFWDDNFTIGQQYLSEIQTGGELGMRPTIYTGGGIYPLFSNFVDEVLEPGERRTIVFAYTLAVPGQWKDALGLYRKAFAYHNGSLTPSYCPTGPIGYAITALSSAYNQATNTYAPGTELGQLVPGDRAFLHDRGITRVGVWTSALHTKYLTGASSVCQDGHGPGGSSSACEFNGAIDLVDPNLTAGPDPSRIDALVDDLASHDLGTYWFARPCTDVLGASITYADGQPQITTGVYEPSVDLRRAAARDRYIARMEHFASRGVKGFYIDAAGCPGDEALFAYARRKLPGIDFLMIEGFRDRSSLSYPQIPFPKAGSYDRSHNQWINFISPDATYYGGEVNSVLIGDELDDFLSKGGQAMMGSISFSPAWFHDHPDIAGDICRRIPVAYANQHARWSHYGSAIPGCAAPVPPDPCP